MFCRCNGVFVEDVRRDGTFIIAHHVSFNSFPILRRFCCALTFSSQATLEVIETFENMASNINLSEKMLVCLGENFGKRKRDHISFFSGKKNL